MPASSAVRVRAYRSRLRRCAKLITLEVGGELSLALAEAGFLREDQTEDTNAIREAIAFRGKADSPFALHMSANDPKRTFLPR
jgi:hypothetical protein